MYSIMVYAQYDDYISTTHMSQVRRVLATACCAAKAVCAMWILVLEQTETTEGGMITIVALLVAISAAIIASVFIVYASFYIHDRLHKHV